MVQTPPFSCALSGHVSSITGAGEGALLGNLVVITGHGNATRQLKIPLPQMQKFKKVLVAPEGHVTKS